MADSCQIPSVLLFWDYDTQWGADRSRGPGGPKNWGPLEFVNTERLLDLHAQYDIKACFAVVGAAALPGERPYHDPDQIRRIYAAGHEIASHSFRHEWLPGLDRLALLETLTRSKDALEQCIGAPVLSFVPPYNQPWDYIRALSISVSERREARKYRVDLENLCEALGETGYRFCRIAYRSLPGRFLEKITGRRRCRPVRLERIAGITCLRLNTPCGFGPQTVEAVEHVSRAGGYVVIYAHPHSLSAENPQNERYLIQLMERVKALRQTGRLSVVQPRDITA